MNILFLCTGNSCRSIIAEAIFNALASPEHHAISAGSQPKGFIHPRSLALLSRKGISTEGYASKSWDSLPYIPDIVITVCGNAAGEVCPAYLAPAIRAHWEVDDPDKATGSDAEIDRAFETTYKILKIRIQALLALPLAELKGDPIQLQVELDHIGILTI